VAGRNGRRPALSRSEIAGAAQTRLRGLARGKADCERADATAACPGGDPSRAWTRSHRRETQPLSAQACHRRCAANEGPEPKGSCPAREGSEPEIRDADPQGADACRSCLPHGPITTSGRLL